MLWVVTCRSLKEPRLWFSLPPHLCCSVFMAAYVIQPRLRFSKAKYIAIVCTHGWTVAINRWFLHWSMINSTNFHQLSIRLVVTVTSSQKHLKHFPLIQILLIMIRRHTYYILPCALQVNLVSSCCVRTTFDPCRLLTVWEQCILHLKHAPVKWSSSSRTRSAAPYLVSFAKTRFARWTSPRIQQMRSPRTLSALR